MLTEWLKQSLKQWRRRVWILRTLRGSARRWALQRYLESSASRAERVAAAKLGEQGRLVFVCHGNIMRSAFATQVARAYSPELASRVVGAGTHATLGRSAQDAALEVSREMAMPLDGHTATPISALGLSANDVVVCMDALNEANVIAAFPSLAHRVFRVGDVVAGCETHGDREIRDPYGRGLEATRDAFGRVAALARAWVNAMADPQKNP